MQVAGAMNVIKEIQRINEKELELGISGEYTMCACLCVCWRAGRLTILEREGTWGQTSHVV